MGKLGIFLRGMSMGAADVVPGVSGGTMALITGIYEELIATLSGISPRLLGVWRRDGFAQAWQQGNFTFLLTLLAGILTSIALLARLISHLLENHPVPVWAFFSGLIVASIFVVLAPLQHKDGRRLLAFLCGGAIALAIALAPALAAVPGSAWVFFFSGALAICAMILPGISGSFILLLLGMYQPVLTAINEGQWLFLGAFLTGCMVGLLSFVHLLRWTLARYHDTVMALLAGFMAGSLLKLWPWRLVSEDQLEQSWLSPAAYAEVMGQAQLGWALAMALLAASLVLLLSRHAPGQTTSAK